MDTFIDIIISNYFPTVIFLLMRMNGIAIKRTMRPRTSLWRKSWEEHCGWVKTWWPRFSSNKASKRRQISSSEGKGDLPLLWLVLRCRKPLPDPTVLYLSPWNRCIKRGHGCSTLLNNQSNRMETRLTGVAGFSLLSWTDSFLFAISAALIAMLEGFWIMKKSRERTACSWIKSKMEIILSMCHLLFEEIYSRNYLSRKKAKQWKMINYQKSIIGREWPL